MHCPHIKPGFESRWRLEIFFTRFVCTYYNNNNNVCVCLIMKDKHYIGLYRLFECNLLFHGFNVYCDFYADNSVFILSYLYLCAWRGAHVGTPNWLLRETWVFKSFRQFSSQRPFLFFSSTTHFSSSSLVLSPKVELILSDFDSKPFWAFLERNSISVE